MITVVKLIILALFMLISSKSLGDYILEKTNKQTEESLGIGFLANIASFWIVEFFVMFLKLSTIWLNIFGMIYLIFVISIMIRNIIKYKTIRFTKKEYVAIVIAIILMVLYCVFIHFGYIETYDSYFYSVLTNSASDTEHISVIDPYTGQNNIQNYYKYISYYYQATFLANIANIQESYLVLAWIMTFMNYLFIAITALTVVRITKNKYINNILTMFFFTFLTSIFRAPFNALHIVTMIIPIYCFKYMFDLFEEKKSSIYLLIISILATISITSTSLFVITAFLYVFFVVASFLKRSDIFINILHASVPVIVLGFLYVYESLDTYIVIPAMLVIIAVLYLLFLNKKVIKVFPILGKISLVVAFVALVAIGNLGAVDGFKKMFTKGDAVAKENLIVIEETEGIDEISYENKNLKLNYEFDSNKHSASMNYIYSNSQKKSSILFILATHSTVLYGGMLVLFLYGVIKKEKSPEFIGLCVYLIVFYNPLVRKGLNAVTTGLEARIYLFFNTIFGLYGIKYLLNVIEEKIEEKHEGKLSNLIKYGSTLYAVLVICSIGLYISNFKPIDFKTYNLLYKVPNTVIEADKFIDENNDIKNNIRIFYTANAFNMSMIDENVNNKIKIVNSKEYMGYFEKKDKVITDKLVISAFFDNEGQATVEDKDGKTINIDETRVRELIKYFNIQYIAFKKPTSEDFIKYIDDNYNIIFSNQDIEIVKVTNKIGV